ncbi:MAG: DNA-binding protein, partial [Candidatus Magasanikbacteria bacterium]|nr:DNA-binding protein [Candidatus Magasanikbacteria bacterium]
MPAIFAYEQGVGKPARVGRITRIRSRQNIIRISFEFDQDIQPLTPEQLVDHAWDFDLNRYEMNRTHWAIKDIDLFAALDEIGIVRRVEAPRPQ